MNKVRFKTRIFETIFFFLFGTIVGIIFFILALEVYDKSFNGFLCILIIDYFLCALFFVSSLLCYQYCEFINGVFIFKCPLYVIRKVKVEDIVLYKRTSINEKTPRMDISYPVIRIYLSEPSNKIKYKYLCSKKSTYYHIYDVKDNYDKFMKLISGDYKMDLLFQEKELFDKLDMMIKHYHKTKKKDPNKYTFNCYYWEVHKYICELEEQGKIISNSNKSISYLKDILKNDGPEYILIINFQSKVFPNRKYKIGVCVRGEPLIEKNKCLN